MLKIITRLLFHYIAIGAYGMGFIISQPSSYFESWYLQHLPTAKTYMASLPDQYNTDIQVVMMILWLLLFGTIHFFLQRIIGGFDKDSALLRLTKEANITFAAEYYQKLSLLLKEKALPPKSNNDILIQILTALRGVLCIGHKQDTFRVNIMIPKEDNGVTSLVLAQWSESGGKTPSATQMAKRFAMGEGLAGTAWQEKEPQYGAPPRFKFGKPSTFKTFTKTVKHYKAFCSVPIFSFAEDGLCETDVIAILNIDCIKRGIIPSSPQKLAKFVDNISIYINAIATHINVTEAPVNSTAVTSDVNQSDTNQDTGSEEHQLE